MGWASGVAAGTAAGPGAVAGVVLVRTRLLTGRYAWMRRKTFLATAVGTGVPFGLGYGIVRPLLPKNPIAAGTTYGVGCSMGVWLLVRALLRALDDPRGDLPLFPSLLQRESAASIGDWVVAGICVALAERAARG
jgi:hypothetical protein